MSLHERTGERDLLLSRWHRPESTGRYLTKERAEKLSAVDIDFCEYCDFCKAPLALIEAQCSTAPPKAARITCEVAALSQLHAYSVSYTPTADGVDLARIRWRRLYPPPWSPTVDMRPADYAQWLWSLRSRHLPHCPTQPNLDFWCSP